MVDNPIIGSKNAEFMLDLANRIRRGELEVQVSDIQESNKACSFCFEGIRGFLGKINIISLALNKKGVDEIYYMCGTCYACSLDDIYEPSDFQKQ